jgi:hypothetical protein
MLHHLLIRIIVFEFFWGSALLVLSPARLPCVQVPFVLLLGLESEDPTKQLNTERNIIFYFFCGMKVPDKKMQKDIDGDRT